jgi:hypothetical protein
MHIRGWARNFENVAPQKKNNLLTKSAIYKTQLRLLKLFKAHFAQQVKLRTQVFTQKI